MKIGRTQTLSFLVFCGFLWTAAAEAQSGLPVYDPASGSYFQLFNDNTHPGVWSAARKRAEIKTYKGIRGRLAEVRSPETHEFLIQSFDLRGTDRAIWIGLRYWCNVQMLQWGRERPYPPTEPGQFRIWHAPWQRYNDRSGGVCGTSGSRKVGYAPVYYLTLYGATRWQAAGASKGFSHYLVEYPAHEEIDKEAATSTKEQESSTE